MSVLYTELDLREYQARSVDKFLKKLYGALLFKGFQTTFTISSDNNRLLVNLCLEECEDLLDILQDTFGQYAHAAA